MSLFNNARNVSRERIIGISLVDILIQIVFVLFIALIAGYEDPENRLRKSEFEEAGRELCDTGPSGRDSIKKCVEDFQKLKEVNGKADTENGKLIVCMPTSDRMHTNYAFKYTIVKRDSLKIDKATIYFDGFTKEYFDYLNEHKMEKSLKSANAIKLGSVISVSKLEENFGFIREVDCYHEALADINVGEERRKHAAPVIATVTKVLKKLAN